MRRNRLIFLGLLILSLISISFYGGPVSYGFFFFVLIVPAVSAVYTLIMFWRFKIYQKIETKVAVAERPVTFYFTLQNEDFYAFSGIRTVFFSDNSTISGLDTDTEYELFPHTGIKKETKLICKYRGEYEVGIRNVIVRDYLKLFDFTFRNRETIKATVIPQLVVLDDISALDALSVSAKDSYIDQTEPDVIVRDYIPGDDIRNINWKLTAATLSPLVRKRIGENVPGISIIMDSRRISHEPDEYLPPENKLLETVIALTYYYIERGIRVNVYAYDRSPVCYSLENTGDFEEFYGGISAFNFDENNTSSSLYGYTSAVSDIANSSAVIFVIQSIDEEYLMQAEKYERSSMAVATFLVTDRKADVSHVTVIGYDDKLKEVLK